LQRKVRKGSDLEIRGRHNLKVKKRKLEFELEKYHRIQDNNI